MEVLFTFEVERVESVVHPRDHHLLIENEHTHWFAFNCVDKVRDHFSVPDKVHSSISTGNINSIIDIKLPSSLNETRDGFQTCDFLLDCHPVAL